MKHQMKYQASQEKKAMAAKITSLAIALLLIVVTIVLSSTYTQSRFVVKKHQGSIIFFDKYVERPLRSEILDTKQHHTASFMHKAGLLAQGQESEPYAYFIADRSYGVLSAGDALTKRYLKEASSSDFRMLKSIGENFFANELVTASLSSSDGRYIFLTPKDNWGEALLHAWVHALAARNMPADLAQRMRPAGNWDAETAFAWRFVDECLALFSSDLYALTLDRPIEAAWADFAGQTSERYAAPDSEIRQREHMLLRISFDYPQRSANYYQQANSFAIFLLDSMGQPAFQQLAQNFLAGNYTSLDKLFSHFGSLDAALIAWQGYTALPR